MKNSIYYLRKQILKAGLILITSILVLSSCEEVIEIDLNSSNPVLVAEGVMEKDSVMRIKLSYTTDYFNNEETKYEEEAVVVITDDNSNSETLSYIGKGIYKGNALLGKVDKHYTLNIETGENKYVASSFLMAPSEIYEIVISESEMKRPGKDEVRYSLEVKFKDDPLTENFYMIKFIVNSEFDNYSLVDDNIFINGDTISYPVMRKSFFKSDEVIINLYSVDKDTYRYYKQLNEAISDGKGPGGSSTPYNPSSNLGEDVMGYFAAWSYVADTVVIQ